MAESNVKQPQPWFRRFFNAFGGTLTSPSKGSQTGPVSASGSVGQTDVSDQRVLQISTVFACVRLISSATASLPLHVYKTEADGKRTKQSIDHPLARLLQYSPNRYMTAQEFRECMTMQLAFYGNAYARIERNSSGDVVSLLPLQSAKMDVSLTDNGDVQFIYSSEGRKKTYTQDEIFHLKGFGFNGLVGLSPVAYAVRSAGIAVAMEDQQHDFYANGAKSPKILMTDQILTDEQRDQVGENFKEISNGPANERLWVLEAGFKAEDIGVSPQDAETLASRKFSVADLARFFGGVPPHLVGDVERSTSWGTGIEQQNRQFLQYVLKPYLDRWENAIIRWLVKKDEAASVFAEHAVEGFLRGDSDSRAQFLSTMTNSGIMTINEGRRLENLPPLEGGDVATRQSQNVPIDQLGSQQSPAQRGV